jgi:hypothetical protein
MSFRIRKAPTFVSKSLMDNTLVPDIPPNEILVDNKIIDIKGDIKSDAIFITETRDCDIPIGTKLFYISMVAGGGNGSLGEIKGNLFHSGCGGEAGKYYYKLPIHIENNSIIRLHCEIGRGGNVDHHNGTDTIVQIYVDNELHTTLKVLGGKGGVNDIIGKSGSYYGEGENGTVNLSTHYHKGGNGGDSIFYKGGTGMKSTTQNIEECNGKWGSAAGGSIPLFEQNQTKGGDGIVIVEM